MPNSPCMFYFLQLFDRAKFEIVLFHLQSKKITRKCNSIWITFFILFHPFLGAFKLFGEILKKRFQRWTSTMISAEKRIETVIPRLSPKYVPENSQMSKNYKIQSFLSIPRDLETIWKNIKHYQIFSRCFTPWIFSEIIDGNILSLIKKIYKKKQKCLKIIFFISFHLYWGALKPFGEISKNHTNVGSSTPCILSAGKKWRWCNFIFSFENLLENPNISENNIFQSFSFILGGLEPIWWTIEKPIFQQMCYFMHIFFRQYFKSINFKPYFN